MTLNQQMKEIVVHPKYRSSNKKLPVRILPCFGLLRGIITQKTEEFILTAAEA
jgi:hypothetical protein